MVTSTCLTGIIFSTRTKNFRMLLSHEVRFNKEYCFLLLWIMCFISNYFFRRESWKTAILFFRKTCCSFDVKCIICTYFQYNATYWNKEIISLMQSNDYLNPELWFVPRKYSNETSVDSSPDSVNKKLTHICQSL